MASITTTYLVPLLIIVSVFPNWAEAAVVSGPYGPGHLDWSPDEFSGRLPDSEHDQTLPMRPSLQSIVPRAAEFKVIDTNRNGIVTMEEWEGMFTVLLALYDANGDGAISMMELHTANLTPHHSNNGRLATLHSKQKISSVAVDFKGQLAREHDHVARKKEQLLASRQRDRYNKQGRP